MPDVLCISTTFLTGRYHGEEWPPSPARLLQALVAGVKTGGYRVLWPEVEPAMRWLEEQPAPSILARPASDTLPYRLAVPNNDMDSVARKWAGGWTDDPARLRTMKTVRPREVHGTDPHVRYLWRLPERGGEEIAKSLRRMADCLYALGWGVDMAYARVEFNPHAGREFEEWAPSAMGRELKVPVPGFLDDLERTYRAFQARTQTMNTDTRPTVYRLQRYQRREERGYPHRVLGLLRPDGSRAHSVAWHNCMEVAAWLRHACAEALRRASADVDVDSFVLGHPKPGSDESDRMSFVPLPSIGHANADGRVRRVMLIEPRLSDGHILEQLALGLRGAWLTRESGEQVCTLIAVEEPRASSYYTAQSRVWRSVTPVILHGYNARKGVISIAKTEVLLRRAFEMAGFAAEAIEGVAFQPAPLWGGTGAAAQIRVPGHLQNYPRYHVEARFREPIPGPVLAGIGRHYGIGVFAATEF